MWNAEEGGGRSERFILTTDYGQDYDKPATLIFLLIYLRTYLLTASRSCRYG